MQQHYPMSMMNRGVNLLLLVALLGQQHVALAAFKTAFQATPRRRFSSASTKRTTQRNVVFDPRTLPPESKEDEEAGESSYQQQEAKKPAFFANRSLKPVKLALPKPEEEETLIENHSKASSAGKNSWMRLWLETAVEEEEEAEEEVSGLVRLSRSGIWTAYFDAEGTGLVYYFNKKTGKSQWDPPARFPTVQLSPAMKKVARARQAQFKKATTLQTKIASARAAGASKAVVVPEKEKPWWSAIAETLTKEWKAREQAQQEAKESWLATMFDEFKSKATSSTALVRRGNWAAYHDAEGSGYVYYFNQKTGASQWTPPKGFPQVPEAEGMKVLTKGPTVLASQGEWKAYFDDKAAAIYYFNGKSGESSWTAPSHNFPKVPITESMKHCARQRQRQKQIGGLFGEFAKKATNWWTRLFENNKEDGTSETTKPQDTFWDVWVKDFQKQSQSFFDSLFDQEQQKGKMSLFNADFSFSFLPKHSLLSGDDHEDNDILRAISRLSPSHGTISLGPAKPKKD